MNPARIVGTALAVLALAGCGTAVAAPTGPAQRVEVGYADGAAVGGVRQVEVPLGGTVELVFTSDVPEDMHLHGYHHHILAAAGGTNSMTFVADLPGVFEGEAESTAVPLVRLQVG